MDYETRIWRGLRFAYTVRAGRKRGVQPSQHESWSLHPDRADCWATTPRRAVQLAARLPRVVLREPGLIVERMRVLTDPFGPDINLHTTKWRMSCIDVACFETGAVLYDSMPPPRERLRYINAARARLPNPEARSELGWRAWSLHRAQEYSHQRTEIDDVLACLEPQAPTYKAPIERVLLKSPHQGTIWHEAELRTPDWDEGDGVRYRSGIHARLMPHSWRYAGWFADGGSEGPKPSAQTVHGVVERFGRYVLGTKGWRAEWVVIRELEAPTAPIAEALRLSYPEVLVHVKGVYDDDEA